jgi:hypothetical protein
MMPAKTKAEEISKVTSIGVLEIQSNFETVLRNADLFVIVCIHVFPPSHLIFQHTIVFQSPFQTFTGLSSMFRFLDCPLLFLSVPLQVEKAQPIRKYIIVEYESKCGKSDDGGKKGCCKKIKTNVHLLNLQSVENSKSCVLGLRCGE